MNIRDLPPKLLRTLAIECEKEFEDWWRTTDGKEFRTGEPLRPIDIWRHAFSKGTAAILRRVDEVKEK